MTQPDTRRHEASAPKRHLRFAHVAIVGKYQAPGSGKVVETLAEFLHDEGCDVSLERDTALNTGLLQYPALDVPAMGRSIDLALVLGGDGTMLGIGRQLARYGVPLVGINQGAWVSSQTFHWAPTRTTCGPSCAASSRKTPGRCWRPASGATAAACSRRRH